MLAAHANDVPVAAETLVERLNGPRHEQALRVFMVIVLAHWAEHLLQAIQIYALGWPVPESRGALGYFFPWLISSEVLHYAYALVMLAGLWILRSGFTGTRDRKWWTIALAIQFFHHFEHLLLQIQAITGHNLFGRPVPTSIVQLWVPRVELHLFYNTIVFIPMVVAMYYHMFPPASEAGKKTCTCAWHSRLASAATRTATEVQDSSSAARRFRSKVTCPTPVWRRWSPPLANRALASTHRSRVHDERRLDPHRVGYPR